MVLSDWLKQSGLTRSAFAEKIGVSPATITALCNDDTAWLSREMAARIAEATKGAVTPNDFIGLQSEDAMEDLNAKVQAVIDAFAKGAIVIVTDDGDRENEGDLIVAAVHCTPEKMAFIVRNTSGIVCAPITRQEARRLKLDMMVADNDAPLGTAFTVSVDVKHGLSTGISAEERTNTCRALANGNMGAGDFVRPGHVFPLVAKDGGVLMRSGHTEAAVDLCKLAELPPVGVICEMVNDDGTVMRGPQIRAFAEKHDLPMISVADLIHYRKMREKLVERTGDFSLETPHGKARGLAYKTPFDTVEHLAVVYGEVAGKKDVLVRLHRANVLDDVFGAHNVVDNASRRLAKEGGVFVYLRDGTAGVPAQSLQAIAPQLAEHESHGSAHKRDQQWREIGLGAQILRDLGLSSVRLLSSSNRRYVGLSGFGIEISANEPLDE